MLGKYRYPMVLALFAVIPLFIGAFFTYVDQQGIVHEPGLYIIIIGEILLLFSGIWLARVYLAKHKRKNQKQLS